MNRFLFTNILDKTLLPFIKDAYPINHRLMMDNDPKHTSLHARAYIQNHNINWWPTPPESPDANPIENMWHEMKEYIRREVKPRTKEQLIEGLLRFWKTVDVAKCNRYIRHLRKVIPQIIALDGRATGY